MYNELILRIKASTKVNLDFQERQNLLDEIESTIQEMLVNYGFTDISFNNSIEKVVLIDDNYEGA